MSSSSTPSGSNNSASEQAHNFNGKRDSSSRKTKLVSVRIQPTIGPSFSLSLLPNTKISTMKESISDKMGLSPQKMTLLLHNNALDSGTLNDNGIDDGSEVRLVPAIESGVTTTNSVDPVAMMKHSMSGISDQQIDDFLNGKFPLSVAIRVGESVVVVNLHRAKVEEIEMEPPPNKKRCVRARRPSNHDDGVNYLESTSSTTKHASLSSRESYQYLNSNHSASELMRAGDMSATTTHRSRRKSHRTLKGRDILAESRHHHHHHRVLGSHDHSSAAYPLAQPDRSMLTYTRDLPGAPMETSVAMSAPAPMETPSRTSIPQAVPIISKDAPVVAPVTVSPELVETKVAASSKEHEKSVDAVSCCSEECMEVSSDTPKSSSTVFTTDLSEQDIVPSTQGTDCHEGDSPTSSTSPDSSAIVCSGHSKSKSVSRSVQTDPEPSTNAKKEGRETRISSRKDGRVISRREVKLPESGISMKRKAVMEAISEILKKMYANTEKGRLPGSFKGRFSSEFTCDSDMREILHSKTTMTSYGSEGDDPNKSGSGEASGTNLLGGNNANLSKAKLKEHQQLKDKVANLKWRMQHNRALKMAKRKGERSPCGWMEALNCDMPRDKPKPINRSGYCGLKRGFLLADDF